MKIALILGGLVLTLVLLVSFKVAFAHPGPTSWDGCHHCWTRCDYWGEIYGWRHSHDGHPCAWQPTIPTPRPTYWWCEIDGEKYYSHLSAENKWKSLIRGLVNEQYWLYLERRANEEDYLHWYANWPYNKCDNSFLIKPQQMKTELLNSQEYWNIHHPPPPPPTWWQRFWDWLF